MDFFLGILDELRVKSANGFICLGMAGIFPSFEGENSDLIKLALVMVILIFVLGLARLMSKREEDD